MEECETSEVESQAFATEGERTFSLPGRQCLLL